MPIKDFQSHCNSLPIMLTLSSTHCAKNYSGIFESAFLFEELTQTAVTAIINPQP